MLALLPEYTLNHGVSSIESIHITPPAPVMAAKVSSTILVTLLLALLAASSVPAAAKGFNARAFAKNFKRGWKVIERIADMVEKTSGDGTDGGHALNDLPTPDTDLERIKRGVVRYVTTGSQQFPVAGFDVTSAVTWTSQCATTHQSVRCNDRLCSKYTYTTSPPGATSSPSTTASLAMSPAPSPGPAAADADDSQQCDADDPAVCSSSDFPGASLYQGGFSLSTQGGKEAFSGEEDTVYACGPAGNNSTKSAVVGLSRDSILLAGSSNNRKQFAYIKHKDMSVLWVGDDVPPVRGRRGFSTMKLVSPVGDGYTSEESLYHVKVTGLKVGDDDGGGGDGSVVDAATGIMVSSDDIPFFAFTFLNPTLFDHLKQKLSSLGQNVTPDLDFDLDDSRRRQLCYASGMKLPAIKLVFAGTDDGEAPAMKIEPAHYSYERSDNGAGAVCLTILPTPLSDGTTVIGTMVQMGRLMSYDLDSNTLTFNSEAFVPSSSSKAATPVFFLSTAWVVASLLVFFIQ